MALVVFLRAINVGGTNLCKPAQLAKQLKNFDVVNIGAVGTFVVRGKVSAPALRQKMAGQLAKSFKIKCEIMIVPARGLLKLAAKDPFARHRHDPKITRFVSVLHKSVPSPARRSLAKEGPSVAAPKFGEGGSVSLPSANDWLLKVIAIEGRFVLGVYRREMKAIGYLGKLEKLLGVPATTRSWSTIEKIVNTLQADR